MTEDEMVGWHHRLNGHEFKQAPGIDNGQRSLACCSPWGHKELDTTEQLNRTERRKKYRKRLSMFVLWFWKELPNQTQSGPISLWSDMESDALSGAPCVVR